MKKFLIAFKILAEVFNNNQLIVFNEIIGVNKVEVIVVTIIDD